MEHPYQSGPVEFAKFGAVHLHNTSLEKAILFWTRIVGMAVREKTNDYAALGTEKETLVVVHQSATGRFEQGYSGLYHFAIHAPDNAAFARMLYRLMANDYTFSPVDHTMSKSIYLNDPDGINVEFTLETPERFKRIITDRGLRVEDVNGNFHSASAFLDIDSVLKYLPDRTTHQVITEQARIGHIHFYATDVSLMHAFYQQLGFEPFNDLPQFLYADVSAGGQYKHRLAMNAWHGLGRPPAPSGNAGLQQYQIIFESTKRLVAALGNVASYKAIGQGYIVSDPTGNTILLSSQ